MKWPFKKKRNADAFINFREEGEDTGEAQLSSGELEFAAVGPYEIIAPIGRGGMGVVYKALDRQKDQTVAIKVLDRRYDVDKKRRKQDYLGREIRLAADKRHDSIVRMFNILEETDREGHQRRCLVMEYVDGHNLRKHIVDRDLTFQQMLEICIRLGHGIDFLHQNGIIHRDIKPENFLFSRDLSQVKIVDFGLSKSVSGVFSRFSRERGGTRRYMCPEQLSRKRLDARSDIFSFGLTMYELFTGQHPCSGATADEIMRQIRSGKYRFDPPSKYNPEIPSQLDRVLLKALRRDPAKRYQSMTEMLLDLTRIGDSRI